MNSSFYQLNIWYARWTSNYFFNGNILQIKNISQTMSLCYWRDICLFLTVLLPFICLLFYYVNNIDAHPTLSWRQPCVRLDFSSVGVFLYFRLNFFMLCSVQPKLVFKLKVKLEHYRQQRTCSHKEKGMNQENYYLLPMTTFTVFRITNKKLMRH